MAQSRNGVLTQVVGGLIPIGGSRGTHCIFSGSCVKSNHRQLAVPQLGTHFITITRMNHFLTSCMPQVRRFASLCQYSFPLQRRPLYLRHLFLVAESKPTWTVPPGQFVRKCPSAIILKQSQQTDVFWVSIIQTQASTTIVFAQCS